jgi:hypothetical protein
MALLDMFDGMNPFGARPSEALTGVLSQADQEKLKNQALISGLLGGVATYFSQPKNQNIGLGAILGKSYLGGMQASQGAYDTALKGKIDALNIAKTNKQIEQEGLTNLDKWIAQRDSLDPNAKDYQTKYDWYTQRIKKETAPDNTSPFFQAIPTEKGYAAFDARTGQIVPLSLGGATNVLPAAQSPNIQGQIKAAETTSTQTAKNVMNAEGTSDLVGRARNILKGVAMDEQGNVVKDAKGNTVKAPLPTASGIGAAADVTSAIFGVAPRGAKEADALGVIGGRLVSKVPRMEGPQSNADLENYKVQAGKVGDPTIPISRRLSALDEVQRITAKYEHINPANGNVPMQTNVVPQSNLNPIQMELLRRKGGK